MTGLQREVLQLYKRALKMVASKPEVRAARIGDGSPATADIRSWDCVQEHRPAWYTFVSNQFRHPDIGGGLRKRDVAAIEHLLRRGNKMVEQYGQPSVKAVALPDGTRDYPLGWVARGGKSR